MMTRRTRRLIEAIEEARDNWTGCDWRHELQDTNGYLQYREDGIPIYCEGGTRTCKYCQDVSAAAIEASARGRLAIEFIKQGKLDKALKEVSKAEKLEDDWGDSPTWLPILRQIELAIAEEGGE